MQVYTPATSDSLGGGERGARKKNTVIPDPMLRNSSSMVWCKALESVFSKALPRDSDELAAIISVWMY